MCAVDMYVMSLLKYLLKSNVIFVLSVEGFRREQNCYG